MFTSLLLLRIQAFVILQNPQITAPLKNASLSVA